VEVTAPDSQPEDEADVMEEQGEGEALPSGPTRIGGTAAEQMPKTAES